MKAIHTLVTAAAMMTGAILGTGKEAIAQSSGNSNSKANIGQVQDSTKSQIVDIDSLDHEVIRNMSLYKILKIYGEEKGIEIFQNHMLIETNMVRKKYNIYPLVLNNNLNNAAQEHANYMDSTMILSHKGKNFSSPTKRAIDHNYITKSLVYENIGFLGFSTPCTIKNMIELRENSTKGHFEKMIDDSHTNVGFGRKGLFFCCSFGN